MRPATSWLKGFLAGIFDAEGSCGAEASFASPTRDPQTHRIGSSLALGRFRFDHVVEHPPPSGGREQRTRAGRPSRADAVLSADRPGDHAASERSTGAAVKSSARLGVESVRAARHRDAHVRHHHRHRRLHRQRRRQPQLLRPPDPHLPRLQRRAATSSARSSSRSTRPRCCAPSWRGRRGRANTSRWARTPTPTSGSRAATG